MTVQTIISDLKYSSYRHNRILGMKPESFKKIGFTDVDMYEEKYQSEINPKN